MLFVRMTQLASKGEELLSKKLCSGLHKNAKTRPKGRAGLPVLSPRSPALPRPRALKKPHAPYVDNCAVGQAGFLEGGN